jgi:uncharacterized membrane protein (UPF0127 family)
MTDLTIFRLIFLYQILIFLSDLLITKRTYSDNGIPNRLHFHDLGAANENMFLEAFNQGLIMHEMGGFDVQKAREVLSVKEKLKENEAMLLFLEESAKHSFWIKDMKFPIDIIWLDSDGKLVHIEKRPEPCISVFTCTSYSPSRDSQFVLDTVAGITQRLNVSVGTDIDFELVG